jgi:secondary thiamine-phosphate synthase enzyme
MRSASFHIRTSARTEIRLITREVGSALTELAAGDGLCTIYTPHTTSAISINEDADPDVLSDLTRAFEKLVPDVRFDHGEGNSDAHFLSTLVGVSVTVPVRDGKLALGRWQGIYFLEFDGPRTREVQVYLG